MQFHSRLKSVCVPRYVTKVSMHLSISHSLCSAVHSYDSLCGRSSRSPIMLSILLVGRAGASPPSRTAAIIFLYIYIYIYLFIYIRVVRRALNLLRASFSPIFQYFSAVNVTRVSFSPIFQYFLTCMPCAMDSSAMEHAATDRNVAILNSDPFTNCLNPIDPSPAALTQ